MQEKNNSEKIFHLVWMGSLFDKVPSLISEIKVDDYGFNGRLMNRGNRFEQGWPAAFTVYIQGNKPVDYFLCGGFYDVVSDPVRIVIQEIAKEDAEFLRVRVVSVLSNQEIGQYWVMNVIKSVDALDWEQTTWATREIPYSDVRAYLSVIKPAIKFELAKNANIFHLTVQGKNMSGIYLSAQLKNSLENANSTLGMKFTPVKVSLTS